MNAAWANRRSILQLCLLAPVLAGCSAVGAFDTVVPKDDGAELAAEGVAYGPDSRQKLDIYRPAGRGGNLPVVVFIYGGSWNSGSRSEYSFVGRALASRGMIVVIIDYRLVPQVRFPGFIEDATLAMSWVKREVAAYGGDHRRIFAMGHSAGAYIAAMVVLEPKYLAAVGLDTSAVRGLIGLAGPYDFLPLDVDATVQAFGAWPQLEETQPVKVVRRRSSPTFLAAGDDDTTVYPRNTTRLAEVLRKTGTPVVERHYPGVGHATLLVGLAKPFRENIPVLEDVVKFIQRT